MRMNTKIWGLIVVGFTLSTWSSSSHATVGKPTIAYSENETPSIQYSQYSSNAWATGATVASTTRKQFWKVVKTHPKGNKKVVLSVESPASGNPHLYASMWDELLNVLTA